VRRDLPIVVAGAGIGGLAAALALARAGRRVAVLERAATIDEVGAGLQIAPNAGRVLQGLGLSDALDAVALSPEAVNIRRARDGAVLARLDISGAKARWGAPFRLFHRADLQQLLLCAVEDCDGTSVRAGARVGDFEEDGGVVELRVHGAAGPEDMEAAALVGADGVRSSVRSFLRTDQSDAPAYSGCTAWRAIVSAADVPVAARKREISVWLGRGAHVVHYPLRDGSIVNVVVVVEDGGARVTEGPLAFSGEQVLREAGFGGCDGELRAVVEAGPSFRRWPLYARPPLTRWSQGAVTLLGDAAHPMLPFLAQGAAQALEDAEALGRAATGGAPLPQAFRAYEQARLARATRVQRASRRQGLFYHAGAPLAFARDIALALLGGQGVLGRAAWLYR